MGFKNGLLILVVQVFFFTAAAQICSGSLGDPIVNITFGAGTNPGAAVASAATGYKFTTNDCPMDGEYTVRNTTSGCFASTWHSVPSDHTGNPNGYFMIVNASYQPSAFYVDTVDVVCSNTTYSFSAWMVNLQKSVGCLPGVDPDLTFRIEALDGTVLQSYKTGVIPIQPSGAWKEYGFYFTAPPGVSRIVLRIINNASGGCGNDIGLDDITFRPCGPLLTASLGGNTIIKNICAGEGGKVTLAGTLSAGYTDAFVQWQESTDNGSTWVNIQGANSTTVNKDFPAATPKGVYQYRLAVSKMENRTIAACR
ncbi:MAG TPA: hypothetical protein VM888_04880, partial [Chitinophagaceae bacterium]|nr:hypothetical protein [Chitinophagaceae bacterium]